MERPPLLGSLSGRSDFELWSASRESSLQLKNYISSVSAFGAEGVAISSSRGGLIQSWHVGTRSLLDTFELRDGSGVAAIDRQLFASNGEGDIVRRATDGDGLLRFAESAPALSLPAYRWDNHMVSR